MHGNWHSLPFMAKDFISPSCQITTQNTRTPFATQKKGSYTQVFTLLQLLLAGVQAFLSFTLYLSEKNFTVLFNVQFLSPFKNPVSWLLIGPCIL